MLFLLVIELMQLGEREKHRSYPSALPRRATGWATAATSPKAPREAHPWPSPPWTASGLRLAGTHAPPRFASSLSQSLVSLQDANQPGNVQALSVRSSMARSDLMAPGSGCQQCSWGCCVFISAGACCGGCAGSFSTAGSGGSPVGAASSKGWPRFHLGNCVLQRWCLQLW